MYNKGSPKNYLFNNKKLKQNEELFYFRIYMFLNYLNFDRCQEASKSVIKIQCYIWIYISKG